MAVSVKELIEQKEAISAKKKELYDLETSIGTITVKQPTAALVSEALKIDEGDPYIIVECTVEPNLKDKSLMDAFGAAEPLDMPRLLFKAGEIASISRKIMDCAGYRTDITSTVHKEIKN